MWHAFDRFAELLKKLGRAHFSSAALNDQAETNSRKIYQTTLQGITKVMVEVMRRENYFLKNKSLYLRQSMSHRSAIASLTVAAKDDEVYLVKSRRMKTLENLTRHILASQKNLEGAVQLMKISVILPQSIIIS